LARARSAGYVKEKPTSKCSLKLVAPTIFRYCALQKAGKSENT